MISSAILFGSLFLALPISILPAPMAGRTIGPDDLLEFVPAVCQEEQGGPEWNDAMECVTAPSNFFRCIGIISVLDPDLIPDPACIKECADIADPYCEIEQECVPCNAVLHSLLQCIVINSDGIDAKITELVDTCPIEC